MKAFRSASKLVLAFAAAATVWSAQALSLLRDGEDLYVSGSVQVGDESILKAAHEESPVRRLVLVNSPGGAFLASLRIARWVEHQRMSTVVVGHCLSACSLIFMAGEQRQFAQAIPGQTHMIGIHGPYSQSTGQLSSAGAQMMLSYYRHRMGDRYDAAVMEQAVYQMKDPTGLLLVPQLGESQTRPWHCASARIRRDQCTVFAHADALSLGLITTAQTHRVRMPAGLALTGAAAWTAALPASGAVTAQADAPGL